jgi:hypothetical protein
MINVYLRGKLALRVLGKLIQGETLILSFFSRSILVLSFS